MPWVRIDDQFPQHPKVVQVGLNGFALQIAGLCYCNRYLTDGFVPNEVLNGLLAGCSTEIITDAVQKLVVVGMWTEQDGGYVIHDYLDYQPSRAHVEAERARNSLAGQRSAQRRVAQSVERGVEHDVNPSQAHTQAQSHPKPREEKRREQESLKSAFDSFWAEYPRKVAKATAEKAWLRLRPSPELQTALMRGLVRAKATWRDPQFIPHAATWLNQRRWEDETPGGDQNGRRDSTAEERADVYARESVRFRPVGT